VIAFYLAAFGGNDRPGKTGESGDRGKSPNGREGARKGGNRDEEE